MDGLVMDDFDTIMEEAVNDEEEKHKHEHEHKYKDSKEKHKHEHEHEDEDEDEAVLSYDSVVLRRSDLDLLRGPHYLNDCIIEFYLCYINSLFGNSGDILLVSPTISYWLANCQDSESFKDFEESHQVGERQVVIFTVNDNRNVSAIDGGTHWSLLVYYRKPNTFVHYDSLGGINRGVARKLYGAVKKHVAAPPTDTSTTHLIVDCVLFNNLKRPKHHHHELMMLQHRHCHQGYFSFYSPYNYYSSIDVDYHDHEIHVDHDHEYPCYREESRMPRQTNLYDCGLYVMAIAKVICEWYYVPSDEDSATTTSVITAAADDDRHILLRINHDDNDDDLRSVAGCFPNITEHLHISLESTMRADLLTLVQQLKSSSAASHPPQPQNQDQDQAQAHEQSQPQAQNQSQQSYI